MASTCLLSQILETAAHSLGKDHRQLADARAALLAGHLRLMARLAAPGGEAVLVTEVTSSEMLAELPALPQGGTRRAVDGTGAKRQPFPRGTSSAATRGPAR